MRRESSVLDILLNIPARVVGRSRGLRERNVQGMGVGYLMLRWGVSKVVKKNELRQVETNIKTDT